MTKAIIKLTREVAQAVRHLDFAAPVDCTYYPLDYARKPHELYLQRYAAAPKEVLFLGMNPGPFGMAQTGVPFGEVASVRDWLGIKAEVDQPRVVHPKRPIQGFACTRSEVSGRRLWGWAQDQFGTPERFFAWAFVHNFCPLVFMDEKGANLTPDKLGREQTAELFEICDQYLRDVVALLKPTTVIGVGNFAATRATKALGKEGPRICTIPHPSPASPVANRGWAQAAQAALDRAGVKLGNG